MESQYKLISSNERLRNRSPGLSAQPSRSCWVVFLAFVTLSNLCILFASLHTWRAAGSATTSASEALPTTSFTTTLPSPTSAVKVPDGLAKVDALPVAYVPFSWHSPWGNPNSTEADPLWDNLNTAHGHIAVDHEWAAANNWQPSMDIPGKPGKGMYLLQSYHQLHCLRIIRTLFLSMHRKTHPQWPMHHALHCFDAIRQHIMCNADNTPLYGHGDGTSGNGQIQQCKSWDALRDYATENTACFRDGEPGMTFEERFGVCDDGTDGLEVGAPGDGTVGTKPTH